MGFPDFPSFYRAASGHKPFPWQERLATLVKTSGWPDQVGVPTGLGKSACLDIALWVLAAQSEIAPCERSAPVRIWYVVNRRLLIDQAHRHGAELAAMLASGKDCQGRDSGIIRTVGEALRSLTPLGLAGGPLQVTSLRGGAALGERPLHPSQPSMVFATVAMFASRWLFRGYGTSRSMRPVDAALAGIDSLVILDEAHLSRPLLDLARKVEHCDIGDPSAVLTPARCRPVMVALTATGESAGERFDLDDSDHAHPVVSKRIHAAKPATLSETSERTLARHMATLARDVVADREQPSTCVVFVNTPRTARDVLRELESMTAGRDLDVVMATGRMREREAARVREMLLDDRKGAPAGRDRSTSRERDLIAVATQTLEVGADLDFDVLVTETCGTRALIQRLGRLNRLGAVHDATAVVVHAPDRKQSPVYGAEPAEVWDRLRETVKGDCVDLSPARVSGVLGAPTDKPQRVGELLHAHVWEWAKTSLAPAGEAPVDLFFEGFDEQAGRVSVCWRAHMPAAGVRLFPGIQEHETVDIPIWELRDAFATSETTVVYRLTDDRSSLEQVAVAALRAGDEVVLPTTVGLYDQNGWNPDARANVLDVSLLHAGVLLMSPDAVANLAPGAQLHALLHRLIDPGEDELAPDEEIDLVQELLQGLRDADLHPWLGDEEWAEYLDSLLPQVQRPVDDVPFLRRVTPRWELMDVRADVFEELSFDASSLALVDHHGAVTDFTSKAAAALGIRAELAGNLAAAARLHDIGKADPRFQRWLDPHPRPDELKAKSRTPRHLVERERVAAGWPMGGRHELLSLRILSEYVASHEGGSTWDPDLVLHLVAAHHGHGRPLVPPVEDLYPPTFTMEVEGEPLTAVSDLEWVDWDQPRRFRALCERYGYWGLALLEALVRQSDHAVSSARLVV